MHALGVPDGDRSRWDRILRPFESASIGPAWIGSWISLTYLLLHCVFDAGFMLLWTFPPHRSPLWASDQWWTDLVNAAIIGYLPAGLEIARRGVARDLSELRPQLRLDEGKFVALRDAATSHGGSIAHGLALIGVVFGTWLLFVDPMMALGATPSASDPVFVWAVIRMLLLGWLLTSFFVYDFKTTLAYVRLARTSVKVDLLDLRSLAPIVRRGQRSALTWVLFSTLFSLFWLGNAASRSNLPLLVAILSMATFAFAGPLMALRQNIVVEKQAVLDALRERIRRARDSSSAGVVSPELADAVAYYQFIERAREWPIDAANLMRFIGYLALGLGSWLGGAIVERILDIALRG